jgi:hypothetical protein
MSPRRLFWSAVLTVSVAIVLQLYSSSHFHRSGYYGQVVSNVALSRAERDNARLQCVRSATRGQTAVCGGLLFAFGSVVLLFSSFWKHEPAPRWIALGLFCGYLLVLFIR